MIAGRLIEGAHKTLAAVFASKHHFGGNVVEGAHKISTVVDHAPTITIGDVEGAHKIS